MWHRQLRMLVATAMLDILDFMLIWLVHLTSHFCLFQSGMTISQISRLVFSWLNSIRLQKIPGNRRHLSSPFRFHINCCDSNNGDTRWRLRILGKWQTFWTSPPRKIRGNDLSTSQTSVHKPLVSPRLGHFSWPSGAAWWVPSACVSGHGKTVVERDSWTAASAVRCTKHKKHTWLSLPLFYYQFQC